MILCNFRIARAPQPGGEEVGGHGKRAQKRKGFPLFCKTNVRAGKRDQKEKGLGVSCARVSARSKAWLAVTRTSGDEQGLRLVEVHAAHWAVVLIEAIDERAHAVVPQLDHPAVQRRQDPWALGVERQALDAVRLGLRQ